MDTIIRGGRVVTPSGIFAADVGIDAGRITALANHLDGPSIHELDAAGRLIFPGGVDVHCHFPWPSKPYASTDSVRSGTLAAVCGGVTTVLDFVVPELGERLNEALDRKLEDVNHGIYADYSAHIAIREASESNLAQIPELVERGFVSFKIFLAYETYRLNDRDVLRVMQAVERAGGILSVHAENGLLADRATYDLVRKGRISLDYYADSRPAECEHEAINRIIHYARAVGLRLHVHHVSTREGARLIGLARRQGFPISGETCPQYLLFTDEAYRTGGIQATYVVIAPPLRKSDDQNALWEALANDDLSVVATDHCPYTLAQKEEGLYDFTCTPGGVAGVETRWPLLYTHGVLGGRMSAERLSAVWASNPAQVFGLHPRKGNLAIGADADLVIVDPERERVLSAAGLHMNTDYSAYEGWQVKGFPVTTLLRGKVVVQDGEPIEDPNGQVISRSRIR